ncbi:aminoglycoside phosphotransferase family protein [Actinokineospora inagensis]|uniref:aminoglycoside phosphotransferase family protein n=1 Tax=Actinokineospora inagensis TaxID=103730 RepID=UPI0003F897AF|nr:aminoglycoside phosphotransferase family protein [Actinokineospora inagensis]
MDKPEQGAGLVERGVTVDGGVVTRPAGRWTASVHHLLRSLRADGLDLVPEPVEVSGEHERLRAIAGRDQGWPFLADIQSAKGAFECGVLVRRLTAALGRYECPPGAVWQSAEGRPGVGMRVQHGDLGPWNLLWSPNGPQVCGVIDWDMAEPGYPTYDIGFLAWFVIPVMDDERARARGFSAPPRRGERLREFARGVGWAPGDVLAEVDRAQREFVRRVINRAGDVGSVWHRLYAMGFAESATVDNARLAGAAVKLGGHDVDELLRAFEGM